MNRRTRGLWELYRDDPDAADFWVWGRRSDPVSRRGFLRGAGMFALGGAIGGAIPFGSNYPAGLIPAAYAASDEPFVIPGKDPGLVILSDRPLNAETPAHLLDDDVTPASRLFVRNNGLPPDGADTDAWMLTVEGESVESARSYSVADLRRAFSSHTLRLQLECAGNGRSEFYPPAQGNQWTTGAVGCPEWTGVRLRDVLHAGGIKKNAVYVAYYGRDRHLSGDPSQVPISRGVPLAKALEEETLIAWQMNGKPIPPLHGHPLRLVCGGWPASTSGKWLARIVVRDRVHDGPKMGGSSYRVPCEPIAAGAEVPDEGMCIIESMPVRSLITSPRSGVVHPLGKPLQLRGHAWAGDRSVERVAVSIDFGQTWTRCKLDPPPNRLAWQRWNSAVQFPLPGYYEIWARATDSAGRSQPMVVPGWNPEGYVNNAAHRIAVQVVA